MKRKLYLLLIITLCIIFIFTLYHILWYHTGNEVKSLEEITNVDLNDLTYITLRHNESEKVIKDPDSLSKIVHKLKKLRFKYKREVRQTGWEYLIILYSKNGNLIQVTPSAIGCSIGNEDYQCNKDFSYIIQKWYEDN